MKKAVAYFRVSTTEQAKEGFSLPSQRERIRKFALKNGYQIVKEFWDNTTATGKKQRKGFNAMLRFLGSSDVKVVIATKVDRLFRNFKDYIALDDLQVEAVFTDEAIPGGATGRLIMDIRVAVARHFIENMKEDVLKGMEKRARQGLHVTHLPFGYQVFNGKAIVVPEKAELIRRAFELYSTGRFSLREICDILHPYGFSGKNGRRIEKSELQRMLRNPFYKGYVHFRGHLYPGQHQAIVSSELWDKVQEVLSRRRQGDGVRKTLRFAYSGLVKCGFCGCSMTGERVLKSRGKEYRYYKCSGYRKGKACQRLTERKLGELFFENVIKKIEIPKSAIDLIIFSIRENLEENLKRFRNEEFALKKELRRIKTWLEKAYEEKLEGKISEEFWNEQRERWENKILSLEAELKKLQSADWMRLSEDVAEVLHLAEKAPVIYLQADHFERRQILEVILSNSFLFGEKLEVIWRKPFDLFVKHASRREWRAWGDSNARPSDPESDALSTELQARPEHP